MYVYNQEELLQSLQAVPLIRFIGGDKRWGIL